MEPMDFFTRQASTIKSQRQTGSPDHTKKLRLILLACHLFIANLGIKGQRTALKVTKHALAEQYLAQDESLSAEAAIKKASRDLASIKSVFGLEGNDKTGFQLKMHFEPPKAFLQLFQHWLTQLNEQSKSKDTVLRVMLEGLVHAIESAFTNDPICIPKLSQALKAKYHKTNIRDTSRPLQQLFNERTMAHFLPLETVSEQGDTFKVDAASEPLLMRKHSREQVGNNQDDTLILARSGLTRSCIYSIIKEETHALTKQVLRLAEAVQNMELWQHQTHGTCVPYALHFNQFDHTYILVVYWQDTGSYQDIPLDSLGNIPNQENVMYYCPSNFNIQLWNQWKSLAYLQV